MRDQGEDDELNLKQLNAFREVMLTGSVSKAAQNLGRTQPSISSLISGLEANIGLALFERRRGRLHPVPEAHFLFEEASAIIERLGRTEQTMKRIRDLDRGSIRMVSMPGPAAFLLPVLISRFVSRHGDVTFSLISRSSEQVQRLVSAQQYDIGLADVGFPDLSQSPLVDHDVMEFNCLCVMRRDDDLADKKVIRPRDLDGKPMATLFESHPTTQQTIAAFDAAGADLQVRFDSQYFIPIFTYVEHGLAYSLVDPLSAKAYELYKGDQGQLTFRPFLPKIQLEASIMTPTHRAPSNLVQAFIGEIRTELEAVSREYRIVADDPE